MSEAGDGAVDWFGNGEGGSEWWRSASSASASHPFQESAAQRANAPNPKETNPERTPRSADIYSVEPRMYLPTAWGMATARGNAIASEPPAMRRAAIAQRRERIALPNVEVISGGYAAGSFDWFGAVSIFAHMVLDLSINI